MNPYDVKAYFESKGYKVTRLKAHAREPGYIVEKNGAKTTVDVIEWVNQNKSISQYVYDRVMSGGFFVILPPVRYPDDHEIRALTKDDIKEVAKTYHIWWKEKDQ